ncbi:MAG: NusG domain II-containing protein [Atopobiaceae bacterium]|nr:NusG domain II-containing protein [Atopobiaceae bacterium]
MAGVLVLAALAVVFALFGPWRASNAGELFAVVHDADGGERRLPLSVDQTCEVQTSLGRNVVVVQDGAARMTEADCPHKSCTQQQPISQPGQQIICLPHQLWVEIVSQGDAPNQLNEDAVRWNEGGSSTNVDLVAR